MSNQILLTLSIRTRGIVCQGIEIFFCQKTGVSTLSLPNHLWIPVHSYYTETWTIKTEDQRRIDVMWVQSRMLRIPVFCLPVYPLISGTWDLS